MAIVLSDATIGTQEAAEYLEVSRPDLMLCAYWRREKFLFLR